MESKSPFTTNQLQSQVISFLRFPLIVCVILIHTQISSINGVEGNMTNAHPFSGVYPFYEFVVYLIAQVFTRVAVPLFFFFSGFLFFYKSNDFSVQLFFRKLKKRVRTLLVPYLFWNIAFILFYNLSKILFKGNSDDFIGTGYNLWDWMITLWDYNNMGCPISYQFWFIRDLMVVTIFAPLIHWLIKKIDYKILLVLGCLYFCGRWFKTPGFSIEAFFFYSLGAYFSITQRSFIDIVKPHTALLGCLFIGMTILIMLTRSYEYVIYFKRLVIVIGMAFTIALSATFIEIEKWKTNHFLSQSSFFIYAYHIIALPVIFKMLSSIPITSDIIAIIVYFLWAMIAIFLGLVLYFVMTKWMPQTTKLITGGR